MEIETTAKMVKRTYAKMSEQIRRYRERACGGRPLTLAEKILAGHLADVPDAEFARGSDYVFLNPDRAALQDVTGQMVMLQFMQTGLDRVAIPTTIHCDHLIRAERGGEQDMATSLGKNSEVFDFLQSASARYGCGFWRPGAGIIHQVVLENYAFPGGLMIGTDSHTPNAGGLGMIAVGVGGLDAAEVMAGSPWELLYPRLIGVKLTGSLSGWAAPKDVILKVAQMLTVSGGTNAILEYFGDGTSSISCTGKATITNMGAEIGATCSVFPYDERMAAYLGVTDRPHVASLADASREMLAADPGVLADPGKYYDQIIEIDLSALEPHVVGPHTPDLARPISQMASDVRSEKYTDAISAALIGSCTNSSYEDMSRAASLADQAKEMGIAAKTPLLVTPGSEQIRATIERDGQMESLRGIGATVLANACGPCIGQWDRPEIDPDTENTIITTFNRNFPGRNDGRRTTLNFIGSPEMIIALSLGGRLSFNPVCDAIEAPDGTRHILQPPPPAPEVPPGGFARPRDVYVPPPETLEESVRVDVAIRPDSGRLQRLEPFEPWDGRDYEAMPIMVKAQGKCTTDHISPAGAWLSLRGHLERLSDNLLLGAVNAFTGEVGRGKNVVTGKSGEPFAQTASKYKAQGVRWVIIGDSNYGEGSSREHAAMTPRYLGCGAVIARGLARIHETNLKKQGVLALTFSDPADYDRILEDDRLSLRDLDGMAPGVQIKCVVSHADGTSEDVMLSHSYNKMQIQWFRAGSALNVLKGRG